MIWRQTIRITKKGDRLFGYLVGNILWWVLMTLPLFALLLKLFYIRHPLYYIEHLVFTMHLHSFIFLGFAVTIPFTDGDTESLFLWSTVIYSVYVLLAVFLFYRQSVLKTLFKFLLLNLAYWILICFTVVLTVLLSFALF